MNLTHGVDASKLPNIAEISNFSKPFIIKQEYGMTKWTVDSDNNYIELSPTTYFYNVDFSADPFDGKIQILVMNEPLPSLIMTLICTLGVFGILLYCKREKKLHQTFNIKI